MQGTLLHLGYDGCHRPFVHQICYYYCYHCYYYYYYYYYYHHLCTKAKHQESYQSSVVVQGVLLHLGYDGWWEQDMQELPLKRMSDAKVYKCFKFVCVTRQIAAELWTVDNHCKSCVLSGNATATACTPVATDEVLHLPIFVYRKDKATLQNVSALFEVVWTVSCLLVAS